MYEPKEIKIMKYSMMHPILRKGQKALWIILCAKLSRFQFGFHQCSKKGRMLTGGRTFQSSIPVLATETQTRTRRTQWGERLSSSEDNTLLKGDGQVSKSSKQHNPKAIVTLGSLWYLKWHLNKTESVLWIQLPPHNEIPPEGGIPTSVW